MTSIQSNQVAIVDGLAQNYSNPRIQIQKLLDFLEAPLSNLFKPGDKVFLKPYLKNGAENSPKSFQVSQPAVIKAILEILNDYGATVEFGDEGSPNPLSEQPHPSRIWLHEIARRTNTKLVNFALSGGKLKQGKTLTPRRYLISKALLETDAIINLSHFQFHPKFVINGCVKNMFNAVIGKQQNHLETLFHNPKQIAKCAVEVCGIVKPMLSIMDMTIFSEMPSREAPFNPSYLLAGRSPVSVDAAAASILGIDPNSIWTCRLGQASGLGSCNIEHINIRGEYKKLPFHLNTNIKKLNIHSRGALERLSQLINETVLRPLPIIDQSACNKCGDCERICPTDAIKHSSNKLLIKKQLCVECMFCADVCQRGAINKIFNAPVRYFRHIAGRPTFVETN